MRRVLALLVALALSSPVLAESPPPDLRYTVRADTTLESLSVELCMDRYAPSRLAAGERRAGRYLRNLRGTRGGVTPSADRGRTMNLNGVRPGDCVAWDVDLADALADAGDRQIRRAGDDLVLRTGLWFWRPGSTSDAIRSEVSFVLPEGFDVSVPWTPVAGDPHRFRPAPTSVRWPDLMAIGRFETRAIDVPGGRLRLAVLDGNPAASVRDMERWIDGAARAVASLYGRFPVPSSQVLVVPTERGPDPVPWAQVLRGGGPAALFYVDPGRDYEEFRDDWTAAHELSHMLLPYVYRNDAWLSEGFASYYQNVLRARVGLLTEEEAWQELYGGFERGRRSTRGGTLDATSRDMYRQRAFMRVYWSGAAYALENDVRLRLGGADARSLDEVLERLQACCLPSPRGWSGDELVARLDELAGTARFGELAERYLASTQFPDLSEVNELLGIRVVSGRVELDHAPRAVALRRAIMSAPRRHAQRPQGNPPEHEAP